MGAAVLPRRGAIRRVVSAERERGAALFVVLVFCALLAGLAAAALQGATSGVRAASVFLDEMRADELGRGAADAVAAWILRGKPGAGRGGAFAVPLGDDEIDVDYRSESARVDVNKAPPALIASLLAQAGADAETVATALARIEALRGPSGAGTPRPLLGSAPADDPSQATVGVPATAASPGRPSPVPAALGSPLEAEAAWRLPRAVAERVLPALTVANGKPGVDPVLADQLVLAALFEGDEARVDDYIQRRGQGFVDTGSALALLPITAQAFAGFGDVSAVRALVRVKVAHRFERRYEIILDPPAFSGEGPRVMSWRPLF